MAKAEEFITIREMARRTKFSIPHCYRIADRLSNTIREGKAVRVSERDYHSYIERLKNVNRLPQQPRGQDTAINEIPEHVEGGLSDT